MAASNDAIRIHVIQHNSGDGASQCCKFSVDPQLTSLSVLHNLVARAFKLTREFETSYLARDDRLPEAVWLPLLSDFDLELAFNRSSEPHLLVKVEYGRSGSAPGIINRSTGDVTKLELAARLPHLTAAAANTYSNKLPGLFKEKMEKTIGLMQKALNWPEDLVAGTEVYINGAEDGRQSPPPLDDIKFQSFLDNVGVVERCDELRYTVYRVGLEPSLRKVAWKLLLDVYPAGLTGRERLDYMKAKSIEYYTLRDTWKNHIAKSTVICDEVLSVSNMVRKDVLRTDRQLPFFSGADDNPNITALFNILTTYALNHPSIGYCQGMSDLASPLLVTQRDEAHAYVCFCALMSRTHPNFHIDGITMSLKFQHLSEALLFYDPEFYVYLQEHQADDLLFCYRWLLLELKREFAFDDAQLMLEVLWASLPSRPPQTSLQLAEVVFNPEAALKASAASQNLSPSKSPSKQNQLPSSALTAARLKSRMKSLQRISNYSNVCALRRQRSIEAMILARRCAGLTRTNSQPTHSSRFVRSGSTDCDLPPPVHPVLSTLSPLSDEVFEVECKNSADETQEDPNATPTRKIKNLKEFLELGRSTKSLSSCGSPSCSPSKTHKLENERLPKPAVKTVNNKGEFGVLNSNSVCVTDDCDNSKCNSFSDSSKYVTSKQMNHYNEHHDRTCKADYNHTECDSFTSIAMRTSSSTSTTSSAVRPQSQITDFADAFGSSDTRRCFSESDASFMAENSEPNAHHHHEEDELLCVEVWENPVASSPLEECPVDTVGSCKESFGNKAQDSHVRANTIGDDGTSWVVGLGGGTAAMPVNRLPPPDRFGGGNPFLMIVCVTILLQHRNFIISQRLDHNDLAMHFDKMIRKHNVKSVLRQARARYNHYRSLFTSSKSTANEAC